MCLGKIRLGLVSLAGIADSGILWLSQWGKVDAVHASGGRSRGPIECQKSPRDPPPFRTCRTFWGACLAPVCKPGRSRQPLHPLSVRERRRALSWFKRFAWNFPFSLTQSIIYPNIRACLKEGARHAAMRQSCLLRSTDDCAAAACGNTLAPAASTQSLGLGTSCRKNASSMSCK